MGNKQESEEKIGFLEKHGNKFIVLGTISLVIAYVFFYFAKSDNQTLSLVFGIIGLVFLVNCLGLIICGIIGSVKSNFRTSLDMYYVLSSKYGFDLKAQYKVYKSTTRGMFFKRKKKEEIREIVTYYSDWKNKFLEDYKDQVFCEDLCFCLKHIRRDVSRLANLYQAVLLPGEIAIITVFYGYGILPMIASLCSVILLTVFLVVYVTKVTNDYYDICEFVDDVSELIEQINRSKKKF